MGLVSFGVPKEEVKFLKDSMKLDVFVEGGTYNGGTAKQMSGKFKKVYTIEKSDAMFDVAKDNLRGISNIKILKGDTREHLQIIMKNNDNMLFWLDAHWSGGKTYGEEDECPLIKELEIIFENNKNYVILIDDARLFLAPPPRPHKIENWPSLSDIVGIMPNNWEMFIVEDVIYLFPERISKSFKLFMQKNITDKWKEHEDKKRSSLERIRRSMLKLLKDNES